MPSFALVTCGPRLDISLACCVRTCVCTVGSFFWRLPNCHVVVTELSRTYSVYLQRFVRKLLLFIVFVELRSLLFAFQVCVYFSVANSLFFGLLFACIHRAATAKRRVYSENLCRSRYRLPRCLRVSYLGIVYGIQPL